MRLESATLTFPSGAARTPPQVFDPCRNLRPELSREGMFRYTADRSVLWSSPDKFLGNRRCQRRER